MKSSQAAVPTLTASSSDLRQAGAPSSAATVPALADSGAADPAGAPSVEASQLPIGEILVQAGLITEDQLAKALRIQSRLETPKPLGTLVMELGWVSRPKLETALRKRRRSLSVEMILVEKGVLTVDQLRTAEAVVTGQPAGSAIKHLVELGALTQRTYLEAFCEKHDLAFVDADVSIVDPQVLKKVSFKYLKRNVLLPLSLQDGKLNIVLPDLSKPELISELEGIYGCSVTVCIGDRAKILETLGILEQAGDSALRVSSTSIQYHNLTNAKEDSRAAGEIVDHILARALREGASDIHVEPMQSKVRVRFRIDGCLVHASDYPVSYAPSVVSRIKVLAQADIAEHRMHQDGRMFVRSNSGEEIDLRASFYVTVFGENAVLRILRKAKALVGLDEMGFSPDTLRTFYEDVLDPTTGIVLVTGPTGSGKTTTLYAAVEKLNDSTRKIITCEDPVEYVIDGITQCSVANRPGMNFVDSLKAIVRQDPDVILIGEIRDRESAEMAIQSALTGHKVLSTFHTEDSIGALVRLVEMHVEPFLIASTVTAVLAQRLLRKLCPYCRTDHTPTPVEIRALSVPREELSRFTLSKGKGCPHCFYTGYRGRTGVYELLVMHDALRDAILQKRPAHEVRRIAFETPGFVCLQEDGIAKALHGDTTLSEVLENCPRSKTVRPIARLAEMYT